MVNTVFKIKFTDPRKVLRKALAPTPTPTPIAVDFETEAIDPQSPNPPKPLGFAVYHPELFKDGAYFSFGHIEGNSCSFDHAKKVLKQMWDWPDGLVFHNAAFDIWVAEHYFDMPRLDATKYHDTMILAFLTDPNRMALDLKGLGEALLDMPRDEQDAIKEYLIANKDALNITVTRNSSTSRFMRHMYYVPGELAGKYAIGDVIRAHKLYGLFLPIIYDKELARNMGDAYLLEMETMLVLMEMRKKGIRIDLAALSNDIIKYTEILADCKKWLIDFLGEDSINLNSNDQLIRALLITNTVNADDLKKTATGKLSASMESLSNALPEDGEFYIVFSYWQKLTKFLNTFMIPWEVAASKNKGLIFSTWNQVKSYNAEKARATGARTGRLSSSPNLQNVPRKDIGKIYKTPLGEFQLPCIRGYVIPYYKNHVLVSVDYSQQELRLLAHYEDGKLLKAYKDNPNLDVHTYVKDMVEDGADVSIVRDQAKAVGFGICYGQGIGGLADELKIQFFEAEKIINAFFKAFPGVDEFIRGLKYQAQKGAPFQTIGGRIYHIEPPSRTGQSRAYRAANTVLQGSAADESKAAAVGYVRIKHPESILLLQVHDEFLASCPIEAAAEEYNKMTGVMESYPCDCPLVAEGVHGKQRWSDCK